MSEIFGNIKKDKDKDSIKSLAAKALGAKAPIKIRPIQGRRGFNKPPIDRKEEQDKEEKGESTVLLTESKTRRQGQILGKSLNRSKTEIPRNTDDSLRIKLNSNINTDENYHVLEANKRGADLRTEQKKEIDLLSNVAKSLGLVSVAISTASYDEMKRMYGDLKVTTDADRGPGSINDDRSGPVHPNQPCPKCGRLGCAGHFMFIDFKDLPIYNPTAFRQIISILNVVCHKCSKLLFSKSFLKEKGIKGSGPEILKKLDNLVDNGNIKTFCQMRAKSERGSMDSVTCGLKCALEAREEKANIITKIAELKTQLKMEGIDNDKKAKLQKRIDKLNENLEDIVCGCTSNSNSKVKRCPKNFKFLIKDSQNQAQLIYEIETRDENNKKVKTKHTFPIENVIKIFKNMSKEDIKLLGFTGGSTPLNLILFGIPVIPLSARPPNYVNGEEGLHPISKKYIDVYKKANAPESIDKERRRVELFVEVERLLIKADKNSPGNVNVSGNQTVMDYIGGKSGVIRQSLMGARVGQFARTVASNNANLRADEISVPQAFKRILVKEITINRNNIASAQELFDNGKIVHMIRKRGKNAGVLIDVHEDQYKSGIVRLIPGDIVFRELRDGDIVVVNRHPTLHKNSLLGFRAVLAPGETIGLNLAITKGFNLDFDGDEVNIWVPLAQKVDTDVLHTIMVQNNIISSRDNQPIIAPLMNAPTFAQRLTRPGVFVPREVMFDIYNKLTNIEPYNDELDRISAANEYDIVDFMKRLEKNGVPFESGRALFSMPLPRDFTYDVKAGVYIRDGILINGTIDKGTLGPTHRSLVQEIHKRYGAIRAMNFITEITVVLDHWSLTEGQSVGISDCIKYGNELYIDIDTDGKIVETVKKVNLLEEASRKEITKAELEIQNMYDPNAKGAEAILVENKMKNRAKNVINAVSKTVKEELAGTRIYIQAEGGGKGSIINVGTLSATPGQQHTHGERFRPTLRDNKIVLNVFDVNEKTAESRGLAKHSFIQGMSPAEFYFHSAGSREGIIDTAINTAPAGTLQRQIIKNMEDIIIHMDGSVRKTNGKIVSIMYGNDSFEAKHLLRKSYKGDDLAVPIDLNSITSYLNSKNGWIQGKNLEKMIDNLEQVIMDPSDEARLLVAFKPLVFKTTRKLKQQESDLKRKMENMKIVDKEIRRIRNNITDSDRKRIAIIRLMNEQKLLEEELKDADIQKEYERLEKEGIKLEDIQTYIIEQLVEAEIAKGAKRKTDEEEGVEKYYNFNLIKTLETINASGNIVYEDKTLREIAEMMLGDTVSDEDYDKELTKLQMKLINAIPIRNRNRNQSKIIKQAIY